MAVTATLEPWKDPSEIAQKLVQMQGQGLANRDTEYQFRQKKALNDLVSKHTNPQGIVLWDNLLKDPAVVQNGVGREVLNEMFANKRAAATTQTDLAAQAGAQRSMGYDPNAMLPEQKMPESRTVYPGESSVPGIDPKTAQAVSSFLNGGRPSSAGSGVRSSAGPRGASAPMVDDDPNTVRVPGGVGGVDGASAGMEPPRQEYGAVPQEDFLTTFQRSYDPSAAPGASMQSAAGGGVAGAAPSLASDMARKTRAEEYIRNGLLAEADRNNPEAFQMAVERDWNNQVQALGPAPTFAMYLKNVKPGDPSGIMTAQADFLRASQEYQAKAQGLTSKFFAGGGEQFDKQRAQDLALQGNERAQTQFEWSKSGRDAVQKMGLDPSRVTPDQAVDLISRRNTLDGLGAMVDHSADALMGKEGPYAQRAAITAIVNNLSQVENVGTEAGNARMNTLLEFAPGVQKAFLEQGIKAVPDAFAKSLVANPAEGYRALRQMVEMTKVDGILSGQLRAAGMDNPFEIQHSAPAGGTAPTTAPGRAPAAAPSAPAAGPRVGERKTKGGIVAEWNGKTWVRVQ